MFDPFDLSEFDGDVYVTSDEHYGHRRINELAGRPFSSVEEMDETIIARHNETVGPHALTIHLGDYALGDRHRGLSYLSRLAGYHLLIDGNHDKCFHGDPKGWRYTREYLDAGFITVTSSMVLRLPSTRPHGPRRTVLLSHFPYAADHTDQVRFAELRLRDTGSWLVHGHVHGAYTVRNRGVNVGVDRWDFRPVPLLEVATLFDDVEAGRRSED